MARKGGGLTRTKTSQAIASRARAVRAKAARLKTPAKPVGKSSSRSKTPSKVSEESASRKKIPAARPFSPRSEKGQKGQTTRSDSASRSRPSDEVRAAAKPRSKGTGSGTGVQAPAERKGDRVPEPGDAAPSFRLAAGDGSEIALSDFAGTSKVVLYFYPRDMTSGCTAQACAFRDMYGRIRSAGAQVLGVSMDSADSHGRFAKKYELPFPLLADTDGSVCRAYGVYKQKSLYGRTFWGIERSTFLIDREGRIRKAWRKVKVADHDREVLEALPAI